MGDGVALRFLDDMDISSEDETHELAEARCHPCGGCMTVDAAALTGT
jgi:hypothetical protein